MLNNCGTASPGTITAGAFQQAGTAPIYLNEGSNIDYLVMAVTLADVYSLLLGDSWKSLIPWK